MKNKIIFFLCLAISIGLFLTVFPALSLVESRVSLSFSGVIQQNLEITHTYIISVFGSSVQVTNGTTGKISYEDNNATQAINFAIGNLNEGDNILFSSGTFILNGSITVTKKNHIGLYFEKGSVLYVSDNMNEPAIVFVGTSRSLISSPTIDGNAANQVIGNGVYGPNGIEITTHRPGFTPVNISDNLITNASIFNVRQFGVYFIGYEVGGFFNVNSGVRDSLFQFCNWNGITFSAGTKENYAANNEVAYSGDVGITTYGISNIIENNTVREINGTSGANNAHWGIGVEGGENNTIIGNTIINCDVGIKLGNSGIAESGTADSGEISLNKVYHCLTAGIEISSNNNMISNNQVNQWDYLGTYKNAITIEGNYNQIIGNMLNSTFPNIIGIQVRSGFDNRITGNSINSPSTAGYLGVDIKSDCIRTVIELNQVSGFRDGAGAKVSLDAINTTIRNNDFTLCRGTKINNSGMTTSIYSNMGYNPIGNITSPILSSTMYIVDSGSNSTWISGGIYTVIESPKDLSISAGAVSAVTKNGATIFTATNCTISLQAGDTFSITFTDTPKISVMGY